MAKYRFKGYTITNCGYHQPDHCVWWEAVDENGAACFYGNTLREVEFMILDYEWEQKMRKKEEEIELLKASKPSGNAAAMREALKLCVEDMCRYCRAEARACDLPQCLDGCETLKMAKAALAAPPRNCDLYNEVEDAWQDYKQFRIQTCEALYFDMMHFWSFAKWLFAPSERKGEAK